MSGFELTFPMINYRFPMIFVEGTGHATYPFGNKDKINVSINNFYVSKYPVTQTLWEHIMENNPSYFKGESRPVECVSFEDLTRGDGFLSGLNSSHGHKYQLKEKPKFRLLTETEWEYAARGGVNWKDGFLFSGSNDISEVGWHSEIKSGTQTHPVGEKLPNQLGIHDMCGNVWEWCQDYYQRDINLIPKDGTPCLIESQERVLRGGCHHNGAVHCTVSKRYAITPDAKDECIGFRIAV